jgi:hypothetical protein
VITVVVLVWAGLVAAGASRALPRAWWVYRSPGLGLCAWYAVLVVSVPAAVVAALWGWSGTRSAVCAWWALCMRAAQGGYGPAGRVLAVGVGVVLLVLAACAAGTGWRAGRALAACRRRYGPLRRPATQRQQLGRSLHGYPAPTTACCDEEAVPPLSTPTACDLVLLCASSSGISIGPWSTSAASIASCIARCLPS